MRETEIVDDELLSELKVFKQSRIGGVIVRHLKESIEHARNVILNKNEKYNQIQVERSRGAYFALKDMLEGFDDLSQFVVITKEYLDDVRRNETD
jgi:hypothetical protein